MRSPGAGDDGLIPGGASCGENGGRLERRGREAVVRVELEPCGTPPARRCFEPRAARRADVLEVPGGGGRCHEENVVAHTREVGVRCEGEPDASGAAPPS